MYLCIYVCMYMYICMYCVFIILYPRDTVLNCVRKTFLSPLPPPPFIPFSPSLPSSLPPLLLPPPPSQVYCWGDNEHGQQGNNCTISSRKPQLVSSLKDHHITKIACGSSHSIAFTSGMPASTVDFTPISFPIPQDPLGTSLTSSRSVEDGHHLTLEVKRPSLTRIILSLQTPLKQQEALAHVLTALQIAYARDAIVNSLGGIASNVLRGGGEGEDLSELQAASTPDAASSSFGPSQALLLAGGAGGGGSAEMTPESGGARKRLGSLVGGAGLVDLTGVLSVEDARVLVDLLKLAVANRVGEKGRETLGTVLTAMGKANPEVCE